MAGLYEPAAVLLGFIDSTDSDLGAVYADAHLALAVEALGDSEFRAATARGAEMSLTDAIDLARSCNLGP